jgi:hypothetical protein
MNRKRGAFAMDPDQIEINEATRDALEQLTIDPPEDAAVAEEAEEDEIQALDRAIGALELLQKQA